MDMPVAARFTLDALRERRAEILAVCARHGVGQVSVFGSLARNAAGPQSDLDLLVELTGSRTPWWPGGLVADLEDLLGIKVDITTRSALSHLVRDQILAEAVEL